jgi:hypothetical protein
MVYRWQLKSRVAGQASGTTQQGISAWAWAALLRLLAIDSEAGNDHVNRITLNLMCYLNYATVAVTIIPRHINPFWK